MYVCMYVYMYAYVYAYCRYDLYMIRTSILTLRDSVGESAKDTLSDVWVHGAVSFDVYRRLLLHRRIRRADPDLTRALRNHEPCEHRLALTRYGFTSKLFCGSPHPFIASPPATPNLLQYYCTANAQCTPPH